MSGPNETLVPLGDWSTALPIHLRLSYSPLSTGWTIQSFLLSRITGCFISLSSCQLSKGPRRRNLGFVDYQEISFDDNKRQLGFRESLNDRKLCKVRTPRFSAFLRAYHGVFEALFRGAGVRLELTMSVRAMCPQEPSDG